MVVQLSSSPDFLFLTALTELSINSSHSLMLECLKRRRGVYGPIFQRQGLEADVEPNTVEEITVFLERHSDGQLHIYAVIECTRPYGCVQVQKSLQKNHKVYLSFGVDHTYAWSALVYASVPSVHKSLEEMDKHPYNSKGRTLRELLADIPRGARKTDRQRVLAFLGLEHQGAGGSSRAIAKVLAQISEEDLAERIRENGWRSAEEVAREAGRCRVGDPAFYQTILSKGGRRVAEFVKWVWDMEGGVQEPALDRMSKLRECAASGSCTCQGRWRPAAERLLQWQGVDAAWFRTLVLRALQLGRRKGTNILITGAPDSGKSFVLKPLGGIYETFVARGQKERFPLQGLPGSEICLMQDIRYESFGLMWDDWLRWGEG